MAVSACDLEVLAASMKRPSFPAAMAILTLINRRTRRERKRGNSVSARINSPVESLLIIALQITAPFLVDYYSAIVKNKAIPVTATILWISPRPIHHTLLVGPLLQKHWGIAVVRLGPRDIVNKKPQVHERSVNQGCSLLCEGRQEPIAL